MVTCDGGAVGRVSFASEQGVILVYDVTRKETFENLEQWLKEVDMYTNRDGVIKLLGRCARLHPSLRVWCSSRLLVLCLCRGAEQMRMPEPLLPRSTPSLSLMRACLHANSGC